jgi:hypothetical protein
VNRDIQLLRQQTQENLQHPIPDVIPEEYQKCMIGIKQNLRYALEIAEAAADPKPSYKLELLQMIVIVISWTFVLTLALYQML